MSKTSQKGRRTPRRPARFGFEVERETFDCQRHSTSKVGPESVQALGAPRQKMWITRRDRSGGPTITVFVQRLPADRSLQGLDLADDLNAGMKLPKMSDRYETKVNDVYRTHTTWDHAHGRLLGALDLKRGYNK